MGQKRTQNIIDEKIGEYLANFETELLAKIGQQLTDRLDKVIEGEEALKSTVTQSEEITETNRKFVEKYEMQMHLNYLITGLIGGMTGGIVMFFLMWYIW